MYLLLDNCLIINRLDIFNVRSCLFLSNLSKENGKTCKTQIIPTLGTKHSHVGNEVFPRVGISSTTAGGARNSGRDTTQTGSPRPVR